jgi:hypothetical protein
MGQRPRANAWRVLSSRNSARMENSSSLIDPHECSRRDALVPDPLSLC